MSKLAATFAVSSLLVCVHSLSAQPTPEPVPASDSTETAAPSSGMPEAMHGEAGTSELTRNEPLAVDGVADASGAGGNEGAAAAGGAEDAAALAAELSKLGLSESSGGSASGVDTSMQLSGFADFSVLTLTLPKGSPWLGAFERHTSMYIGNFNLYISKSITDSVRTFGEVRFTMLPNGAASATTGSANGEYISTLAQDYSDFRRPIKWGGIEIERVFLEWTVHRALAIRIGRFLTPYGVWNVDHGSPTVITIQRPFIIGQEVFPERQTGVELLGQYSISAESTIGYHLTISNGLGPVSEYRDFDANKALGGRVFWRYDGLGQLRIGGSGFYGSDTAAVEIPGLSSDGKYVAYTQKISSKSDVLSLAADLQWIYSGFHFQAEFLTQQRRFDEKGRVGANNPLLGRYIAPNDKLTLGVYGLVGYRFDWFGIMPYGLLQWMDTNDPVNSVSFLVTAVEVGVNVRPIDAVVVKLEYTWGKFPNGYIVGRQPIQFLQAQVAWAF